MLPKTVAQEGGGGGAVIRRFTRLQFKAGSSHPDPDSHLSTACASGLPVLAVQMARAVGLVHFKGKLSASLAQIFPLLEQSRPTRQMQLYGWVSPGRPL